MVAPLLRPSAMLSRRLILKFSAALVTLAMMLGVAEAVVRSYLPSRNVGPSFTIFDDEHGVLLKRNFDCGRWTPEFSMSLSTNSLGQRGPEPEAGDQGGVLFLGDSFTLGYGVNDGEEFPALVRERLSHDLARSVPVWNTGVGGVGNGRWLKVLQGEALKWKPKVVVLQLCGNDFDDNQSEALYSISTAGELVESAAAKAPSVKRALQKFIEFVPGLAYSHLVCSFRGGRRGHGGAQHATKVSTVQDSPADELTWEILKQAIKESRALGAQVVLLTAAVEEARVARARELGVRVIAIPLKRHKPELYYERDGHWNSRGHEYAAELVVEALLQ